MADRAADANNCTPTRKGNGEPIENSLCSRVPVPLTTHLLSADDAIALLASRLNLTPRQAEVVHWIAEGKSNSEVGIILDCSFNTVKFHLKEIFQRLNVHSRTAVASYAYRAHIAGPLRASEIKASSSRSKSK